MPVQIFTDSIIKTFNKTVEKIIYNNTRPQIIWWNEEIKAAIKEKNSAISK